MHTRYTRIAIVAGLLVCLTAAPRPVSASPDPQVQGAPPPTIRLITSQSTADELERIRRALGREPAFTIDESQIRFYLQVLAPKPTFADFVKDKDLMGGVVPDSQMTHREFLDMVTPKELYSAAGIRPTEALQMAVTGLIGQILVQKAFESATDNWRARQIQELNERIDQELAAIRRVR